MKTEKKPGVFQIKSKKTGDVIYTEATLNCSAKSRTMYEALKKNMHPDKALRKACSENGIKDLSFEILEYCKAEDLPAVLKKHLTGVAEVQAPAKGKPVKQLDLEGKLVKEWPSAAVAAVELELRQNRIEAVCNGKSKFHGGFGWKYGKVTKKPVKPAAKPAAKPVAEKKSDKPAAEKPGESAAEKKQSEPVPGNNKQGESTAEKSDESTAKKEQNGPAAE